MCPSSARTTWSIVISAADLRAQRVLALLQAQLLQASGQAAQAARLLAGLETTGFPGSARPLLLARAEASLEVARAGGDKAALRASAEALQTWVAERRGDAAAWALLAQCAQALGLQLRALRAEAEAHAALGDIGGAMDRLRAAQRLARSGSAAPDFIEASIIDARLRDLNALRRAQAAAARGDRSGSKQEPPP